MPRPGNRKRVSHNNRGWREGKPGVNEQFIGHCVVTNKRSFQSKDHAKRQVRQMEAAGKAIPGRDLSVYRCLACGYYHVGKKPPQGERERMWNR